MKCIRLSFDPVWIGSGRQIDISSVTPVQHVRIASTPDDIHLAGANHRILSATSINKNISTLNLDGRKVEQIGFPGVKQSYLSRDA